MGQNTPSHWLVAYDIGDKKRLNRVFKIMKKEGIPIQHSLFFVHASARKMDTLMALLAQLVDPNEDDIRAYRVPQSPWQATLGQPILPADAWLDPQQSFLPGFG